MRLRIEDRHHVGRIFRRAVELAVGIDRGLAAVRRNQIVQILVRLRPVPRGHDHVAFFALRTLRLVLRQFASGDAIGPVAEILVGHAAELTGDPVRHQLAGLSGGDAAHPGLLTGLETSELRGYRARRFLAELVTADAIDIAHALAPDILRDVLRNIGGPAEILGRRDFHHRVPVDRRIIMRGRALVRRRHRRVVQHLPRLRPQTRRIDQTVAAHENLVIGDRQIRDDITPLLVRHDAFGVAGGKVRGLGNHPDPALGAIWACDETADVVCINGYRPRLLSPEFRRTGCTKSGCCDPAEKNVAQIHQRVLRIRLTFSLLTTGPSEKSHASDKMREIACHAACRAPYPVPDVG